MQKGAILIILLQKMKITSKGLKNSSSEPKAEGEEDAGEASHAEGSEDTREEPFETEAGRGDRLLLQLPVQAGHLLHRALQSAVGAQQALPLLRPHLLSPLLQLH